MARNVGIGIQDFETIIKNDCFYIDKTSFGCVETTKLLPANFTFY